MKDYSIILESIYDSAINPERWNETLDHCVDAVGSRSATLHIVEMQELSPYRINAASSVFTQPETSALVLKYLAEFARYEMELCEFIMRQGPQVLLEDSDIYTNYSEIRQRPDYQFAEQSFGIYRRAGARLNDNGNWYDMVAFQFDASITHIPARCKENIVALLPHMSKAAEISRMFQELQAKYLAALGAIEYLEIGLAVCLRDGAIVIKNTAVDKVLDDGDGIVQGRGGRLSLTDMNQAPNFAHAIASAFDTAKGNGSETEHLFLVDRPSFKSPYLVEVSPLKDRSGEIEANLSGALVVIIDPTVTYSYSIEKIQLAYRLTVAESEVCSMVLAGKSNTEIAALRNVRSDTVKAQISSIKAKTGAGNRFELIRLASKTATLLASRD